MANSHNTAHKVTSASTSDVVDDLDPSFPKTLSDLSLHLNHSQDNPYSSSSIYKTLHSLRKSTLSIPNRLKSVLHDAEFVEALSTYLNEHHPLSPSVPQNQTGNANSNEDQYHSIWPLIPNLRSGSWPLSPTLQRTSQHSYLSANSCSSSEASLPVNAYLKSTDGHVSHWSFSQRRLNIPILSLLGSSGGAVLIDTTRRGKVYPDALRRTVSIWSSVWNQALFPEFDGTGALPCAFQGFGLEPGEISQITTRLPGFVRDLQGLRLDLDLIKSQTRRPVRLLWLSQPTTRRDWEWCFGDLGRRIEDERRTWKATRGIDVNVLVCCSASKPVPGAEMSQEGYIQGAGDDSEGWSLGLTADLFWKWKEELMLVIDSGRDEEVEEVVRRAVEAEKTTRGIGSTATGGRARVLVRPTKQVFICAGGGAGSTKETEEDFMVIVDCQAAPLGAEEVGKSKILGLGCKDGKLGSKMLREKLLLVKTNVEQVLRKDSNAKILVLCSTGKDLSVGVVLVLLCCFFNDTGQPDLAGSRTIDKTFIKRRLAWISSSKPDANPSRATLQAVNSFLIDRPG